MGLSGALYNFLFSPEKQYSQRHDIRTSLAITILPSKSIPDQNAVLLCIWQFYPRVSFPRSSFGTGAFFHFTLFLSSQITIYTLLVFQIFRAKGFLQEIFFYIYDLQMEHKDCKCGNAK